MIHHVVMFRLEGEAEAVSAASKAFKEGLEALPAKIEELASMEVHLNDIDAAGNWTLVLHAQCPTQEALAAYAGHREHLACVAIIKPMIAGRACVDYAE